MFKQKNKRSMVGMVIIILVMLTVTAGLIKTTMEKRVLDTKVEELEATKKDLTEKQKKLEEDTQKLSEEVDLKEQELKDEKDRLKKEKGNVKKQQEQIQQKEDEISQLKKRLNQANTQASAKSNSTNNSKPKDTAQAKNVSTNNNTNSSGKVKARHTMNATHYSAFCPTGCTGKTADGTDVSGTIAPNGMRVVAVDPSVIPLGTKVRVKGHGHDFVAIARDTGGDIKGNRIDILVGSTKEAYALGRGNVTVEIID